MFGHLMSDCILYLVWSHTFSIECPYRHGWNRRTILPSVCLPPLFSFSHCLLHHCRSQWCSLSPWSFLQDLECCYLILIDFSVVSEWSSMEMVIKKKEQLKHRSCFHDVSIVKQSFAGHPLLDQRIHVHNVWLWADRRKCIHRHCCTVTINNQQSSNVVVLSNIFSVVIRAVKLVDSSSV